MSGYIRVIVGKEWAELVRRRGMVLIMTLVPVGVLIVAVAAALIVPTLMSEEEAFEDPEVAWIVSAVAEHTPGLGDREPETVFQILMLRQILLLHLLVPMAVAMSVAAYSIVGEKANPSSGSPSKSVNRMKNPHCPFRLQSFTRIVDFPWGNVISTISVSSSTPRTPEKR